MDFDSLEISEWDSSNVSFGDTCGLLLHKVHGSWSDFYQGVKICNESEKGLSYEMRKWTGCRWEAYSSMAMFEVEPVLAATQRRQ